MSSADTYLAMYLRFSRYALGPPNIRAIPKYYITFAVQYSHTMIPTILITLGGIAQGLASVIRKHSSTTEHRATTITTTTMLVNAVLCIPLVFYQFRLPTDHFTWVLTLLSAGLFALAAAFFFKAYQHADLSVVSILHRTSIIHIAVIGVIFLQEKISPVGVIGLFLLFFGSASVLYEKRQMKFTKGAWYALISAFLGALSAVVDKQVLHDFSPYTYVFVNSILVSCMFLWRKDTLPESMRFLRRYPKQIVSSSILGVVGFTILMVLLADTQVSQTMAVYKTISFFVSVILGILLYKETNKLPQKIIGLTLAILGMILLYK